MIGSLFIVLIVLGCGVYQYQKGTFVKSFVAIVVSICASVVAFGYFELLGNVFISREILLSWAHSFSFVLLFVLTFAVLQTAAIQLIRQPINLGLWPERIGRVICGLFLGLILSGILFTIVAMSPLSAKYPYQRFDERIPDPENPSKLRLNADGFATGWFSMISRGSLSGKRSFAALHPAFLDQLFLNRLNVDYEVPIIASSEAIKVPQKGVWLASEGLKDSDGNPVQPKSGYNLTIVRVGITSSIEGDDKFSPSQLRLICRKKGDDKNPFTGKGKDVYPVGYLKSSNELQIKNLADHIQISRSDIDFAFYVPDEFVPILIEFRQNGIYQLPPPVSYDQSPAAEELSMMLEEQKRAAEKAKEEAEKKAKEKETAEPNKPTE
ncbi:MAG: CvpA family protein [Phycisphaerae bacterium]|nr:CvpA family protein [Phycisphaerae bacterium]